MKKIPPGFSVRVDRLVERHDVELEAGQVQVVVVLRGPDQVDRAELGEVGGAEMGFADVAEVGVGGDAVALLGDVGRASQVRKPLGDVALRPHRAG